MNILLGIGYLVLVVFNIILYHKIFNVVYFDLGKGILKELIGAVLAAGIEIGLIGKYIFHIDWEDTKEDNNSSIEYNIEDQENTDSYNTYESSTNMDTIDKNSMDVDYTDYEYLVADNEEKYGNMAYFALADIDNDGIKELIIEVGTCDADIVNEVYTLINNEAEYLGEFEGNADLYMSKNSYGIYASYENMGNVITYYIEKDGNILNLNEIKDGKTKRDIDFSKKIEWETLSGNNSNSKEQEQEGVYDSYYIFAESDSRFLKDSELKEL